jgi:hypothetical protein
VLSSNLSRNLLSSTRFPKYPVEGFGDQSSDLVDGSWFDIETHDALVLYWNFNTTIT